MTPWTKADCYAPVVSLPVVRLLTALAVRHKRPLKQGDFKNAFVQASLPENETTIIRPPTGCFCSGSSSFWRLRKSIWFALGSPSLVQVVVFHSYFSGNRTFSMQE
ncbi:MAG: reverse transcriptase domain-containing protein [bacterium]